MAEVMVSGKRVALKDKYPFKDNRELIPLYRAMDGDKPETVIPVAVKMIESWELEGDPQNPETYEEMDTLDLWVLFRGINDFWVDRVVLQPKNLVSGSTKA